MPYLPGTSTLSIVGPIGGPLPVLSTSHKQKPAARRHANRGRFHSAGELTVRPHAAQRHGKVLHVARGSGGEVPLPFIAPSPGLADWAQGVLFTDGRGFTGRQALLRHPGSHVAGASKDQLLLPSLYPAAVNKPGSPDSVQAKLQPPMSPVFPSPVPSLSNNHMDMPGEGINASPSSMAAPSSWRNVKQNMLGFASRARRASAQENLDEMVLTTASPDAPPCTAMPHTVLNFIGAVPWFRGATNRKLRKLVSRGSTVFFPAGSILIRENSYGSSFYILISGRVGISSASRRIDVRLDTPGSFFGEAALAVQVHVRREATVGALEDVWCFRLKADHLTDLQVDLEPLKKIYLAKLLSRVRWFDMLTATKLAALGNLMEMHSYPANKTIFDEGDIADRMYIVVSGRVGIFKRKQGGNEPGASAGAEEDTWASCNVLLAEFEPHSKSPWFGESALFPSVQEGASAHGAAPVAAPRSGTAFTVQSTQLLSVHTSQARKVYELIPGFFKMNQTFKAAYAMTNQLNGTAAGPSHLHSTHVLPVGAGGFEDSFSKKNPYPQHQDIATVAANLVEKIKASINTNEATGSAGGIV